ncbi:MAG: Hsp70 family protein [Candidatus Hydrogenedentota bacterium]
MAQHCIGIDFGTTNSSAAVAEANAVRVLELDPANDNPASLPSLLYITAEGEALAGREAAEAYIARNVGREVELKQVDLGLDIEGYVGAEPDKSESYRPPRDPSAAVREAVRAKATVEVNSPGRLFQSLKSSLRLKGFKGTDVFGRHYQIEELTALLLRAIKERIDAHTGADVETAVFGRPVRFSDRPEEDALAEGRLERAAELAGFKNVVFFYEPVAACVEYAIAMDRRQRLMVVDIGGGTCDVCVMEFGGAAGAAERLAESQILGVAGVPVAGDAIDREILRAKLFPYFGSRSRYGPSKLPMPQYVYAALADWQNLYKLNTEEIMNWLIASEMSSDQPEAIRRLRTLIHKNYGYPLARKVEQAKKTLSYEEQARIELEEEGLDLHVDLERPEFAHIIEHTLDEMRRSIEEAEKAAEMRPEDIDLVLTTGGTSLIPAVRKMLEDRYGPDRLLQRDTFVSVASGLAVVAQYV